MAILRNPRKQNFTTICNDALRDQDLSLKARGLLASMMSLPDNWEFSEAGLDKIFPKDGLASIRSGLKELEQSGYLIRKRSRDEHGRMSNVVWTISDYPISEKPQLEKPQLEKPIVDNPSVDNHTQLNNNQLKNERLNNNQSKNYSTCEAARRYDYDFFQTIYNSACPNLPSCRTLTDKRKKAIREFLREFAPEQWREICQRANASSFLTGGGSRGWKADIDFLLKPDKAAKIWEGGYQDEKKAGAYANGRKRQLDDEELTSIHRLMNTPDDQL